MGAKTRNSGCNIPSRETPINLPQPRGELKIPSYSALFTAKRPVPTALSGFFSPFRRFTRVTQIFQRWSLSVTTVTVLRLSFMTVPDRRPPCGESKFTRAPGWNCIIDFVSVQRLQHLQALDDAVIQRH